MVASETWASENCGFSLTTCSSSTRAKSIFAIAHLALGKIDLARVELEQVVKENPQFSEAHVSLATIYYRLKRKADGDREGAIVRKLDAERQAKQPGALATGGAVKNTP